MKEKVLLLGLSTGGPAHLNQILSNVSRLKAHVIVAQHMKEDVISFFINDLSSSFSHLLFESTPTILSHKKKIAVCASCSYISKANSRDIHVECKDEQGKFTPDINQLFLSSVKLCKYYRVYAAILTGIGDDGVKGLMELKKSGAVTVAESSESAPVYGMPRCAVESGAADHVYNLNDMINFFLSEGLFDA